MSRFEKIFRVRNAERQPRLSRRTHPLAATLFRDMGVASIQYRASSTSKLRVDLLQVPHSTGRMRTLLIVALVLALAGLGCAGRRKAHFSPTGQTPGSKLIVTPETALIGKVVAFDSEARFAVLNFPIGHMPALGQRLNVYRLGMKVGEIKVTGPQRDDNIVGDLTVGEARMGDEVRQQ